MLNNDMPVFIQVEIKVGVKSTETKKFWFGDIYYESCGTDSKTIIATSAGPLKEER